MLALAVATFSTLSPMHVAALLAIAIVAYGLTRERVRLGRPADEGGDPAAARQMDVRLSAVTLGIWIVAQVVDMLPSRYDVAFSLPIHICDLTGLIAVVAVRSRRRLPRAMLYYWGLGLSIQAVAQPELAGGPETAEFWVFWMPHGAIMAVAFYDLIGRRFWPTWRDCFAVLVTLAIYVAAVMPIDLKLGVNYGFVGDVTGGPLDFLGPWPLRVCKAVVAVCFLLAVMTVPWDVIRRRREIRAEATRQAEAAGRTADPLAPPTAASPSTQASLHSAG